MINPEEREKMRKKSVLLTEAQRSYDAWIESSHAIEFLGMCVPDPESQPDDEPGGHGEGQL